MTRFRARLSSLVSLLPRPLHAAAWRSAAVRHRRGWPWTHAPAAAISLLLSFPLLLFLLLVPTTADSHPAAAPSPAACPADYTASTCPSAPSPPPSPPISADQTSTVPPPVPSPPDYPAPSAEISPSPPPLRLPVLWMAPFLSAGGYSSEAVAFATSLAASPRAPPLRIAQHGDGTNWDFISGLPDPTIRTLEELFEGTAGAAGREDGAEMEYGSEGGSGEWDRLWHAEREGDDEYETIENGEESSSSSSRASPLHGIIICHSEPGAWAPPLFQTPPCPPPSLHPSAFLVGRTMFETDRVTPTHVQRCNRMQQVWVPSSFHMHSFAASGVQPDKLRVLPQPVHVRTFHPPSLSPTLRPALPPADLVLGPDLLLRTRVGGGGEGDSGEERKGVLEDEMNGGSGGSEADEGWCVDAGGELEGGGVGGDGSLAREGGGSGERPFVFLSVFKWEQRKGWDVLLKAYLSTFTASHPVVLYLVTNAYHTDSNFAAKISSFVRSANLSQPADGWPSLYVRSEHVAQSDLPNVFRAADCFVLPTRGEGWGRPIVEAMATGLPVIATNWSGITEYLNEDNGYPIPVDHLSEVPDGPFKGHLWAEPSVPELSKLMRHVLSDRVGSRKKGCAARKDMVQRYAPEKIAEVLLELLGKVEASILDQRTAVG